MQKVRFDHLIYSHVGEYTSLASNGFPKDTISKISTKEPKVEPNSLVNVAHCLFQVPIDDNMIAIGRLERAQTDRGPFVHHHTIAVQHRDYVRLGLHPAFFQEHFVSYPDFKECLSGKSILQPLEVSLNGRYDESAAILEYFQDKPALVSALDTVISLATTDNRNLKLDFPTMEKATEFAFLMMALIPPQFRAALSFVAGVEPENSGLFKMVLRVSSREVYTLADSSKRIRHPLSKEIANSVFLGKDIGTVHRDFEEMGNSLYLVDPDLTHQQVLTHTLSAYPRPSQLKPVVTARIQELSAVGNLEQALGIARNARIVWDGVEEIEELERGIALEHQIKSGAADEVFLAFPFSSLLEGMEGLVQSGKVQFEQIVPFFNKKAEAFSHGLDAQNHPHLCRAFLLYTLDANIRTVTAESLRRNPASGPNLAESIAILQPADRDLCARNLLTRIQNLKFHPPEEMNRLLSEDGDVSASLLLILPKLVLKLDGIIENRDLAAIAGEYCDVLTQSILKPKERVTFWDRTLGRTVFAFDPVRLERAIQLHLYDVLVELRTRFGSERAFSMRFKRFTDVRGELQALDQRALKGKTK